MRNKFVFGLSQSRVTQMIRGQGKLEVMGWSLMIKDNDYSSMRSALQVKGYLNARIFPNLSGVTTESGNSASDFFVVVLFFTLSALGKGLSNLTVICR